jgi:hypothetical protein
VERSESRIRQVTIQPRWIFSLMASIAVSSCNPFAPALEEGDPYADLFGDPTTVDGFFTNFRSAYELRDVSLYEPLLDSAFVFVYRDFDAQVDRQWGFAEDLAITRRLFRSATFIELKWNQIIARDVTDGTRRARVIRSFNLTVGIDGADVFRGDGNVNFLLTRPDSISAWRLVRWRDESEL